MSSINNSLANANSYPPGTFVNFGDNRQSLLTYEPHRVWTNSKIQYDTSTNALIVDGDLDVQGIIRGAVESSSINDSITHAESTWSSNKIQSELDKKPDIDDSQPRPDAVYSSMKTITKIRHTDMSQSFNFTNEHPRYGNDGFIGTQAARGFGFKPSRDMLITSLSLRRHETSNHSAIAIAIYSSDENATAIELLGRSTQAIAESTGWWTTEFDPPLKVHRGQYYVLMSASATGTPISRYSAIEHQNNGTIQQDYPVELIVPSSNEVFLYSTSAGFPELPASHIGTSSTTPAFRIEGILANFDLFNMINQDAISSIETVTIDDEQASTTTVWSSFKTGEVIQQQTDQLQSEINDAISNIEAVDTGPIYAAIDSKPDIDDDTVSTASAWSSFKTDEVIQQQTDQLQGEINNTQNIITSIESRSIDTLYLEADLILPKSASIPAGVNGTRIRDHPTVRAMTDAYSSAKYFKAPTISELVITLIPAYDGWLAATLQLRRDSDGAIGIGIVNTDWNVLGSSTAPTQYTLAQLFQAIENAWNTHEDLQHAPISFEIIDAYQYSVTVQTQPGYTIRESTNSRAWYWFSANDNVGAQLNRILGLITPSNPQHEYHTITHTIDIRDPLPISGATTYPAIETDGFVDPTSTGYMISTPRQRHRISTTAFSQTDLTLRFAQLTTLPRIVSCGVLEVAGMSGNISCRIIGRTNSSITIVFSDSIGNIIDIESQHTDHKRITFWLRLEGIIAN